MGAEPKIKRSLTTPIRMPEGTLEQQRLRRDTNIFIDMLSGHKLPDAIIAATAEAWQIPIVTRNPKDFHTLTVAVHVPYQIDASTGKLFGVKPPYRPTA